jgi:hypothetical protein
MATIKRIGYGQVEPNHLSAQRTAQIYAQLPANKDIEVLENGQYVKYDYKANEVNFEGEGEWMMVFNEVKLYDGWRETYKDFAMKKSNYTEGVMTPRVIKTNVGDIYTTNCVAEEEIELGSELSPRAEDGILSLDGDKSIVFQVVKIYNLADGQDAVKLMRIK